MKLKAFCVIATMIFTLPLWCKADISLPLTSPVTEIPDDEDHPKRHKAPPAPVMCFIDFEGGNVSFSSSAVGEVEAYEIWEESGEICLGSYDNATAFVVALSNLSGDYRVKFLTINNYYTGYVNK